MKLYIKNMVCIRCQMVVKAELEKLGLQYVYVKIGEADIIEDVQPQQLEQLKTELKKAGLVLMDNKKSVLVEKIKSAIIELVHYTEGQCVNDAINKLSQFNIWHLILFTSREEKLLTDYQQLTGFQKRKIFWQISGLILVSGIIITLLIVFIANSSITW